MVEARTKTGKRGVDVARRVDEQLIAFIEQERGWLEPEAQPLLDELESLVASGGKRLRPRFCYWGHRAAGGADRVEIVRAGAALELLHTMALIHDDVMDRSNLRRNRASTFRALAELSAGTAHTGDPQRFGASAAILTGLLGFVLADRLFASSGFDAPSISRAAPAFDRMRTSAIAGQYLDLLAAHRGDADETTARRIAELKSGSYTVAEPLAIGALLATDDPSVVDVLARYGRPLGEAFQIRDDVLGTFGDPGVTGKDADGDLREGKQTVLLAIAKRRASAAERRVLDGVGDDAISAERADAVREAIAATGALEEADDLIGRLTAQAKAALGTGVLDDRARDALLALADAATARTS